MAHAVAVALLAATVSVASPGVATAVEPCPPGTPSAERFAGLPDRVAIGRRELFSLDFDHDDWYVEGDIAVTMTDEEEATVFTDITADPLAEYWLRLDPGDTALTVTATFEQVTFADDDAAPFSCLQTISRRVTGYTAPVRLICNRWTRDGANIPYRVMRPRRCSIWRAAWAHYQSASFVKARWRSWGRPVARGRATLTYNMGYRARVRVRAYRLRFDCTGRYRVYTRASIRGPDGHGVVRPDTCA